MAMPSSFDRVSAADLMQAATGDGDERALLDLAAARLGKPLPRSRPLWSATFVTGLAGRGTGLILIMDHVLTDGLAGLAALAGQAAETAPTRAGRFPAPAPDPRGTGGTWGH